jgi:hypothetical protein
MAGAPEASLTLPAISPYPEKRVLGHLDHLALLLDTLVASLAPPATPRVIEEGVLGGLNLLALVIDLLEAPLTLPAVSRCSEKRVLRHLDPLALILDAPVASLAPPAISAMMEEGVLGHLNLLALVSDALESSVARPAVSEVAVGMLRHGNGIYRPAGGRKQADPQRKEEAKNGPGWKDLRIAIPHESSRKWRCGRVSLLRRKLPAPAEHGLGRSGPSQSPR